MNQLPKKLLKLRKHYNYSQSYLAEVLGVDTLEYMNYENGSGMIGYEQIRKLASLYHVDFEQIFRNSDEVDLYDTNTADTDEINIEYFTAKEGFLEKVLNFYSQNKITTTIIIILLITIAIMFIILKNTARPFTPVRENINRLSASETTIIYIDDYAGVHGSGSNANGELSNLTSSGAIKVCEGEGFSVILNEDGTVNSAGLIARFANEVRDWKNIVDIAAGASHVLSVDSNGRVHCIGAAESGACELSDTRNIVKVFATANGSIVMDDSGGISYAGNFIGSGSIGNYKNILDVASSESILAVLCEDGTIDVYTRTSTNYLDAESWDDIVDVACGESFVAGLDSYGKVHIEIDNDAISTEVGKWSNIIAIAAGSDYLVGFDGVKIFGVGNNSYGQFAKEELVKQRLDMVSDVEYNIDEEYVSVQFKGVSNASAYIVSIDVGIGVNRRIEDAEVVRFENDNMIEGRTYTISIVSVGEGDYTDSDVFRLNFVYEKVEEEYTFTQGQFKTADEFINYLVALGVDKGRISGRDSQRSCEAGAEILDTSLDGRTLTKSELLGMDIEFTYCKAEENEEE